MVSRGRAAGRALDDRSGGRAHRVLRRARKPRTFLRGALELGRRVGPLGARPGVGGSLERGFVSLVVKGRAAPGHAEVVSAEEPERLDAGSLFRRWAAFVAGRLARAGVAPGDLDDAVQEVFLTAHRRGGFVADRAHEKTWLAEIAI